MIGLLVVAQLAVAAHAPDSAPTCAPIEVTVAARARGMIAPQISAPASSASFQLLKSTVVTRLERDGAGPSALTEATFLMASDAVGRVTLPPIVATLGAQRVAAAIAPIDVQPAGTLQPMVIVRAWLDRGRARAGPSDTLYVGEQVDYVVDVQLNEPARLRLRRNPTFFPPEMPGVLAYDLAPPTAITHVGRRCFETLSYRRALFPLFAGRTAIAPAALTYSLPLSTSFFSREESFELRTDSVRFVALDVPVSGRPASFTGAVGELGATSRLSTSHARMGDPVVLTLRLEGAGNVKLWPRPAIALEWASVATGGERVQVDTSHARVRGAKEFDWLLTPREAGRKEVPPIEYPYFDTDRHVYDGARTLTLSLDVATATLATVDSVPVVRLGIRRTLRDEMPLPVTSRPWYWLLLVAAPVPAALRRARSRSLRRAGGVSPMRRLRHAASRSETLTAREVRRLFLDAVGERVPAAKGPTQRAPFVRALRRVGVTEQTADAAGNLLEQLDGAAFSPSGTTESGAVTAASALVSAIDREAMKPSNTAVTSGLLLVAATATLLYALPDGVTSTFTRGVEAYDHAAFTTSQQLFARVVARAPRAQDAWANLGATAFSRGDSAAAVRGWQRALRLDPLDIETRERLGAIQPPVLRSPGYVPPIPVNLLALAALACWLGAWLVLVIPPARRPGRARTLAGGALVCAGVLLLGALEMRDRLDHQGLAVLRSSRMLLDAPGSQNAVASATTGETGRLGGREGAWVRFALDGARAGWVPAASVLALDAPFTDD